VIHGTVRGEMKSDRQKKRLENNITEWTGMNLNETVLRKTGMDGEPVDRSSVASPMTTAK
jgi:hypothetical protein